MPHILIEKHEHLPGKQICNYSARHRNKEAKGIYSNILPRNPRKTRKNKSLTSNISVFFRGFRG